MNILALTFDIYVIITITLSLLLMVGY